MKKFWLRKMGTNVVVQWTKGQAALPDMVPISHEDAMKTRARFSKDQTDAVKARALASQEGQAPQEAALNAAKSVEKKKNDITTMDRIALCEKAAELKILVEDDMEVEEVRALVASADASDGNPTQPAPEAPVAPIEPQVPSVPVVIKLADGPSTRDDLEGMKRNDMFGVIDDEELRIPKAGTADSLRAEIRRVRAEKAAVPTAEPEAPVETPGTEEPPVTE